MRITMLWAIVLAMLSVGTQGQTRGLLADEQNTVDVFQRVTDGVVHVNARATISSPFEKRTQAGSTGTGFVIDREGRILTAFHVIKDMDEISVVLNNKHRFAARLVGTAPQLDLAVLQIDAPKEELVPLVLGNSAHLQVGQKVIAIGNAVGLHNSLTAGVVSGVQRTLDETPVELADCLIQTNAAINPGNSGGPLVNSAGEVVGINDAEIEGTQNIGFAIPIDLARGVIPDLIEMGHPYRPVLGFSGAEITPSVAKMFGIPVDHGFLIEEVLPNSPAAEAGLRAGGRVVMASEKASDKVYVLGGDIIIAVNGEPFDTASGMAKLLLHSRPGEQLRLRVYRQGQTVEMQVRLVRMQMQF